MSQVFSVLVLLVLLHVFISLLLFLPLLVLLFIIISILKIYSPHSEQSWTPNSDECNNWRTSQIEVDENSNPVQADFENEARNQETNSGYSSRNRNNNINDSSAVNGGFSRNVSSQSFELGGNSNRNEDVRRHDNENNVDYNDYENHPTATDNDGSNINSNDNPNRNQNDLNSDYNDSHSIRDHGYYEERDLTTRIGSSNSHSPNNQQTTRTRRESRQSDNNASDRDIAVGSNPTSLYSGSSSSRELLFSSDSERDCECGYQYNYRYQTQYRYGSTKRKSFTSKSLVNVAQKIDKYFVYSPSDYNGKTSKHDKETKPRTSTFNNLSGSNFWSKFQDLLPNSVPPPSGSQNNGVLNDVFKPKQNSIFKKLSNVFTTIYDSNYNYSSDDEMNSLPLLPTHADIRPEGNSDTDDLTT